MTTMKSGARRAGPIRDAPVTHAIRPAPSWIELDRARAPVGKTLTPLAFRPFLLQSWGLVEEGAFWPVIFGAAADAWRRWILEAKTVSRRTRSQGGLDLIAAYRRGLAFAVLGHSACGEG